MEHFILFVSIYFLFMSAVTILIGRAQGRSKESIEEINFDLIFIFFCYIIYYMIYYVEY